MTIINLGQNIKNTYVKILESNQCLEVKKPEKICKYIASP